MNINKSRQAALIILIMLLYVISALSAIGLFAGILATIWTGDMRWLWSAIVLGVVAALTGGAATKE